VLLFSEWAQLPSSGLKDKEFRKRFKTYLAPLNRRDNQWYGTKESGKVVLTCINRRLQSRKPCRCRSVTLHFSTLTDRGALQGFLCALKKCRGRR